jgi:hypothetical protein
MRLENPFFRREMRALSRGTFAPFSWVLALQALLLLIPIGMRQWWLTDPRDGPVMQRWPLLLLFFCTHAGICAVAGWHAGARVFQEEHRQGGLEGLRLVSTSPWRWLPLKLVFPVYALALTWLSAAPFYWAVVLRGWFQPRELWPSALLAGTAGLVTLGLALLLPPEGARPARVDHRITLAEVATRGAQLALPYWMAVIVANLAWHWLLTVTRSAWPPFESRLFVWGAWPSAAGLVPVMGTLSTDRGLAILLGGYLLSALGAAVETANPVSGLARTAARVTRVLAAGTAYYLWLGFTLPGAGAEFRVVAVGVVPALLVAWPLLARARARRAVDRFSTREIGALARLTDNPVLIRDLRVALRPASLTRRLLVNSFWILAVLSAAGIFAFVPFAAVFRFGVGSDPVARFVGQAAAAAILLGFWIVVPGLLYFGGRGMTYWQVERRQNTLLQLLASPLPSRTLLLGRWAASVLVGLSRLAPFLAAFLVGVGITTEGRGFSDTVPAGLWLASMGLVLSAGFAGSVRKLDTPADLGAAVCIAVYVVLAEGFGLASLANQAPSFGSIEFSGMLCVYSLAMAPLNVLLTYFVYRRGLADLEWARGFGRGKRDEG